MRNLGLIFLSATSVLAFAAPAYAADSDQGGSGQASVAGDEIIVTARRKEETAQDVPLVVSAVTSPSSTS